MKAARRALVSVAVALPLVLVASTARAQSPAGRLIQAARAQLEAPNPDSAATLLERALQPGAGATTAEQTRAFVLHGIAQLLRDNPGAARASFTQALRRDPTLRVDTLAFFSGALAREFAAARSTLAAAAALPAAQAQPDRGAQAQAQTPAGRLIEAARARLEAPDPDSAVTLLETALAPDRGATAAEQARAFVLYGIAQLLRDNTEAARDAFRQALQRDPALNVDSLSFFTGALAREFEAERSAAAPTTPSALTVSVRLPADTTLLPRDGRLPIATQPTFPARVVSSIAPADAPLAILWSDTQAVGSAGTGWNLRGRDGALVRPGRYALRVSASDSLGQIAPITERFLVITRPVAVDTTALPPPLPASAYARETRRVHPGSPLWLFAGAAASAFLLVYDPIDPRTRCAGCQQRLSGWPDKMPPAAPSAGIFLAGRHTQVLSDSLHHNAELRALDAQRRAAIALSRAQAAGLDSAAMPAPRDSAYQPERHRSPLWLLAGEGAFAAADLIATANLRNIPCPAPPASCAEGWSYPSWKLPVELGTVLAGIALFAWGPRAASRESVRLSAELREQDAQRRAAIAQANAQARSNAPIRIRVEGTAR